MKMNEITSAADGLDPNNRAATVKLIDIKVEDDMDKVLNKIQYEFGLLKTELAHIETKFENKFEHVENKFNHVESKLSTGYTFFGIALGVISAVLAILGIMVAVLVFKK